MGVGYGESVLVYIYIYQHWDYHVAVSEERIRAKTILVQPSS